MTGSHFHHPMLDATVNYRLAHIRLVCKGCGASWKLKPPYAALVTGCRFLCYFLWAAAALWMVNERVVFFILCLVLSVLLLLLPGKLVTAQIEKTKDYARYFAGYDASAEE